MFGTRWRLGATAGLLVAALAGCDFLTGGGTTTTTTPNLAAENAVKKQRGDLLGAAYDADITANEARDVAIIYCGNLSYKDLTSAKCKAEPQRKELFEKSLACVGAIDAYNENRGPENELVRDESRNPRRGGQPITCAYDKK